MLSALVALMAFYGLRCMLTRTPWQSTGERRLCGVLRRRDREHHQRQRPLAARLPAVRPALGADRRKPPLYDTRDAGTPAVGGKPRGPCAPGTAGVQIF